MRGKVVIVGAGPGDPELITVKGLRALREADVVVYDRLVPEDLLKWAKPGAELIFAGKAAGKKRFTQEEINELLVKRAKEGKLAVRLKGGDPMVLGRGGEEMLAL
ncbi:TPA: uroporphyrin-III C-methyltransferase, partial [Candidatus Micrarchaeota archaeon]|nr:uroporphyrin-III C-methyltransferase [Candidatus Micrarchaeota archaeon]